MKRQLLICLSVTIFLFLGSKDLLAQINFSAGSGFRYLKGINASSIAANWMDQGFSDATWSVGNAPFHYGDGTGGITLSDMQNSYTTLYLRSTVSVSQVELLSDVTFTINYDDGFVIWINGSEALRQNAPDVLAYNALAPLSGGHESGTWETFVVQVSKLNLQEGTNTIAVQLFNNDIASSDLFFDMTMSATLTTPELKDTVGLIFSSASGFKNSSFNLTIKSPDPTAHVIYTLDGSNPQNSGTIITAGTTATININPNSTTGRGTTPGVVVRASITKTGYKPSKPESRTFIYIENVKTQGYPGGDWPSGDINGQVIDLPMDANVVNDSRYSGLMDDALLAIPSISVITANENLFDPSTGIYVNAFGHGLDWEKECSVELINPDESPGFNVNAGIRIRGGWSRHPDFAKHAFRLFFRDVYGDAKLRYPLFGEEGAQEFDKIDLRCEQNYAWSNGDSRNTLIREIFSRDSQRDMGQPYSRSKYYHLYLNGMYYGIYQTQERTEARYASDYFGGSADDYDVIKVNTENWSYQIEATDGNTQNWLKLYDLIKKDLSINANYYVLEGKDANGNCDKNGEVYINIDNLIDYMLTIFYTGNFDAPTSSFGSNKGPNNFYAIDDRTDKSTGYMFFNHDAEHAMFSESTGTGTGLYEDRVNIGTCTDGMKMEVNGFGSFHPQWIHFKLSQNAEYRMRFADRAYKYMQGDGALTPAKCTERVNKRVAEIETAIIAESARWGDRNGWTSFTKDDQWLPEINKLLDDFIPVRTNIVINQLKQAELYTSLVPPKVSKAGTAITAEKVAVSSAFDITFDNTNANGSIYYTVDGTDPREIGGTVSSKAISIAKNGSISIASSTILKARIYNNGSWSALKQINFVKSVEDYSNLKVTELHYHPADYIVGTDTIDGKDLEFIEFKNIGENAINLSGLVLDSAVYYEFPDNTMLAQKQFWVVASKPSKFYGFYGEQASGNFSGNFGNAGDEVLLKTASNNPVIHFIYDDQNPWPEQPDGDGYSMVSTYFNPTGDPNDESYWRSSLRLYGSPFRDDDGQVDVEVNEMISESGLLIYPNPASDYIIISQKAENASDLIEVSIFNISGSLVYQAKSVNNARLNLNTLNLDAGVYFIQVGTGLTLETVKLIIE